MSKQVLVTGLGIVSGIGITVEETLESLLNGRSGIGPLKYLQTIHNDIPCSEIQLSDDQMREMLSIPFDVPITRTSLMGIVAAKNALADAGITPDRDLRIGFISSTTVGGMEKSEQYYKDFLENDSRNEYIEIHDCGACTEVIADYFGGFCYVSTISTACSSSANAIVLATNLIKQGILDIAVAGGTECLTKFHLNGFNSLMILDRSHCRPFDATRAGLNLGEGAAYLVLESEENASARNAKPVCMINGYGNACDSYHQTASSPDGKGATLAMQNALDMSNLKPSDIDYINAHGTGTTNNDESEGVAIMNVFGKTIPPVSSTKAFTGHTTSAAGSVEAVISILAIIENFLPPNLNFKNQMEKLNFTPVKVLRRNVKMDHVLSNSFGFGGNNTSIVFSKSAAIKIISMSVYIQGIGNISIQNTFGQNGLPEPVWYKEPYVRCIDPDFKNFISPIDARRMSKLIKRAIITAKAAIADSGIEMPDAIISGTGLGSIDDTEKFLNAMIDNNEKFLQPTYFIQSTHNTISSQIAINLKCYGHNNTFVHGGISFECALAEAMMLFKDKRISSALVGGYDEMTPAYFKLLGRVGLWKKEVADSIELKNSITPGTFAGEGSVSVVLSGNKTEKSYASVEDIDLLYQPEDIETSIETFISRNGLKTSDIDLVVMGINGNAPGDLIYKKIGSGVFAGNAQAWYKHLSGEYFTSTGFGFWLTANCLKSGKVPGYVTLNNKSTGNLKNVLLINHYRNKNYSLILFSAC